MSKVKEVLGKVWDELKPAADQGRSEVAAALFQGGAYVMYPKSEPGMAPEELPLAKEVPANDEKPMGMDELRALAREYHPEREKDPGMDM